VRRAGSLRYNARMMEVTRPWIGQHTLAAAITPNVTISAPIFGVPNHPERAAAEKLSRFRIVGFGAITQTVPSDADGTILVNLKVQNITEAATDVIMTGAGAGAGDLEALTANTFKGWALNAETSEVERTIAPDDLVYVEIVNNSAAIDTNVAAGKLMFVLSLMPIDVPGEEFGEDL